MKQEEVRNMSQIVYRQMLRAKVHRPTVTRTEVDYEGSLTLDADLMRAAGMVPYERIDVYDCDNGQRFSTYLIEGKPGSGEVCVNGAAAHLATTGHRIIIAAYCSIPEEQIGSHKPTIVLVDAKNRIKSTSHKIVAGTVVTG